MNTPVMTIGDLARRTGVPAKVLRRHHDLGLIYSLGRSRAGYRLFDEHALWCVEVIATLRGLGLTEAEIRQLAATCDDSARPVGPQLAELLARSRTRIEDRIRDLDEQRRRIDEFEHHHHDALTRATSHDRAAAPPWVPDPRTCGCGA